MNYEMLMRRLLLFVMVFFFYNVVSAQLAGRWEGMALVNGKNIAIAFNITSADSDALSATMDVLAQGAKAIPCDDIKARGDSLFIVIGSILARYAGHLDSDRSTMTGVLRQGNSNTTLNLKRNGEAIALVRPQIPQPPFLYTSQDVEYRNKDQSVYLGATLTKPTGAGPFPAAILISGSGPQDRDSEIYGHKIFLVIADYLTRRGVAVLRVDDRGMGKSVGPTNGTSADFAQDVITSLDFLKNRKDIDPKKIGLFGHSEGGVIAPMVAALRPEDVAFIISLAGPSEPILDLMGQQNTAMLKSMKVQDSVAGSYGQMMKGLMRAASTAADTATAYRQATEVFEAWRATVHPGMAAGLTGVNDSTGIPRYIHTMLKTLRVPWMQYLLAYAPADNLAKLNCPVLAINGGKGIQVLAEPNLAGWQAAGEGKDFTVKEMPGLNHLFQHCEKCTQAEYGELTETFSPEVLQIMGDWLVEKVAK